MVLIAVLAAITLLPALLAMLGERIDSLRVPFVRTRTARPQPHGWARWARGVGEHPWPAMIAAVAILVVLAMPILDLELGQQDNGQLPKSTTRAGLRPAERGASGRHNGPFLIAVDFDGSRRIPTTRS